MKWWHWLILELLIIFEVIAWIYFFPSEIEYDLGKGLIGFALISAIEKYRETNRRKTMDYKKVMTCGECLKYEFCPVANHKANHKACMKITTRENYTIEQNAGENRIEGGVVGISGSVKEKHYIPFSFNCGLIAYCGTKSIWVKSKFDSNCVLQITGYTVNDEGKHCVWLTDSWITLEKLFDDWLFLDDSPIGVEE